MAFFSSSHIFMVGIKGSGMSSLAIHLKKLNTHVSGWDTDEVFPTDQELIKHSIAFSHNIPPQESLSSIDYLIYSSAYTLDHPIIKEAKKMGIPIYSYYEALALLSTTSPTYCVCGTHGKTTSVVSLSHMLHDYSFLHSTICGSAITVSDNPEKEESSHPKPLILEACEYQDHFLLLDIQGMYITNVEYEHVDYFKDEDKLFSSFLQLIDHLPHSAPIVCNREEKGIDRIIDYVEQYRADITLITYGKNKGTFTYSYPYQNDINSIYIKELSKEFKVALVGDKLVSDLLGSALLAMMIVKHAVDVDFLGTLLSSLHNFKGAKGRVEKLSPDSHPFFLYNDYAHHPSEIRSSLQAIHLLHPKSKVVLLFFPHTVSRMQTFYHDFVSALTLCDTLIIFPVALSARGDGSQEEAIQISRNLAKDCGGIYVDKIKEAVNIVSTVLHSKDVCITMGAGNTILTIDSLLEIKELPL